MSQAEITEQAARIGELEARETILVHSNSSLNILRAENDSLKEVISLSENSRLMDEYLKLERANARQAERIAELEGKEFDWARANAKCTDTIAAQAAVIVTAKTALEDASFAADWWANSFYNALRHVRNLKDGIARFDDVIQNLEACARQLQKDWKPFYYRDALAELEKGCVP